jgi:hypothetical protein
MGLVIRMISIARATLKIGMANLVDNVKRLISLEKAEMAWRKRPKCSINGQNGRSLAGSKARFSSTVRKCMRPKRPNDVDRAVQLASS